MKAPQIFITALLIGLSGCTTTSHRTEPVAEERAQQSSPTRPSQLQRVYEGPRLAPPAVDTPELPWRRNRTYAETWIPLERWSRQFECGPLRQIGPGPNPTFALSTPCGDFLVQTKTVLAKWAGLELRLGYEPQFIDNQPFVHWLDLEKTLKPLINGSAAALNSNEVIVIDPGHGGQNKGTTSVLDGACEKEFTLDCALRLGRLLSDQGWQVYLTRTNDLNVPLSDRVRLAQEVNANLFISLHFNSAAPSQEQAGLETYCLTPTGLPSTITRDYADELSAAYPNNAFDAENLLYAVRLHRALLTVVNTDRGIRRARFMTVLREQQCPAVLIEAGYLSNPDEAGQIATPEYRQKLAEALAAALSPTDQTGVTADDERLP